MEAFVLAKQAQEDASPVSPTAPPVRPGGRGAGGQQGSLGALGKRATSMLCRTGHIFVFSLVNLKVFLKY